MSDKEILRTTCPRDCYDGCGISVIRRDGRITKVLGDRDHPVSRGALCGKCALAYNGVWRDPAARLSRPLRRSGPKGSGMFSPISWGEALAETAERLQAAVAESGSQSILHTHYTGTCSLLANAFPLRFFNRLGATEIDPDSICNAAGHVALDYVIGSSVKGFDPKTARDANCILVWGANPSASAPHAHKHWLKESPAKVIVVDPIRHETAAEADLHLQPFPGSDAALAFAMLHVLLRDGFLDRPFIKAHTLGWDEVEPLVMQSTSDWAEGVTGVPAAQIEAAARLYATGPSLLWLGQGLQRQPNGGNVMRACALLPAATGNFGKPGAGLYYLNGSGPRKIDGGYIEASHLRQGPAHSVSHMELAPLLADPARSKVLINWNMNIATSAPRQAELIAALKREDLFTVVVDLFQTDTADYADIVLPAASFLEFDDLVTPYFHLLMSAQVKAEDPPGEALPNQEIFRRLAKAMGYQDPELQEPDRDIIDTLLERSGLGIDFDSLAAKGTIDPWDDPLVVFEDLHFPTPSGRIEIASEAAERDGHPRVPQPRHDPRPENGQIRLLSPASKWQMNDSYGNDPAVLKQLGSASVALHPDDIARLGLTSGETVRLSNQVGELDLLLASDASLPVGVALSHKGRWLRQDTPGGNVNCLNPAVAADMGASTSVHGVEVKIAPAD